MNCYQLSCGHWQSEPFDLPIGSILGCIRCNTLRAIVIGMTTGMQVLAGDGQREGEAAA